MRFDERELHPQLSLRRGYGLTNDVGVFVSIHAGLMVIDELIQYLRVRSRGAKAAALQSRSPLKGLILCDVRHYVIVLVLNRSLKPSPFSGLRVCSPGVYSPGARGQGPNQFVNHHYSRARATNRRINSSMTVNPAWTDTQVPNQFVNHRFSRAHATNHRINSSMTISRRAKAHCSPLQGMSSSQLSPLHRGFATNSTTECSPFSGLRFVAREFTPGCAANDRG